MTRNAIIMAAGMSSRFAPLSLETPKALLNVKDEIMIERQIGQLREAGIDEIVIVVGYLKEKFEYLKEKYHVILVENPYYKQMNNFSTLYVAREYLKNTWICSADNYFTENVFMEESENAFYASSLLNFENGFTDKKGLIWTASGDAAVSNAQAKFGSYSLASTSGGLSTPDSEALRPGTGDYTIAFWYRPNVLTNWHTMFNKGYWNAAGGLAIILGAGSIKVCSNTSDSGDIGHGITANTWSFIELSRVNGEAYLFTNGILRMKFAQPQDLNSTLPLALMSGGGIVGGASGFMDEFRFVVGRGWHTENYELPITPF